jgi:F-type H+-transporting ATPase subunit delta
VYFGVPTFGTNIERVDVSEPTSISSGIAARYATAIFDLAKVDKLAKAIKARIGKDVNIDASVDEALIGGLVVKVGSQMIDTSIRSKLNSLQNVMKEVG